jgi:hypothetical protein
MSNDLVKRLRERSRQYVENEYNFDKRAADRIEKLEAALRQVCENWDSPKFDTDWEYLVELCGVFGERTRIARKALEGKE